MTHVAAVRRLKADLGDLLARHEQTRDLNEFRRYADDSLGFVRKVLKGKPWSKQEEIADAVQRSPLTVVRSCNAAGKDWIAAHLALWWVYARRGLVLLTGPTERQVREIVMGEVARAWSKARDLPGELFQMALRLGRTEHAGIIAFTSTEASRLTGFHAPRVLAVITEAQGVEDFAWEGVLACATGPEDRVLAVGNPLSPSGRFFAVSRAGNWAHVQISAFEHPNLSGDGEHIPGGPSGAFVERIRREYGEGSGTYRARVLGEFPDEGEDGLFRRSWLDAAAERHESDELRNGDGALVVAVDPARFGPDSTVVAVRRGSALERLVHWQRASTMETVGRIRELLTEVGIEPGQYAGITVVDAIGIGAGVHDRLLELRYRVEAFNGGRTAWDRDRFFNARGESYWLLRERLENGEIALPRDERLFDELLALRWRPTSDGKVQVEPKDRLRGRLGRSPDRADAACMAFYPYVAGGREPGDYGITI